jgi:regulator of replication initiation timing
VAAPRASSSRAEAGGAGGLGPRKHGLSSDGEEQENAYLRRNVEHLRQSKRQLENQVGDLGRRVKFLEEQNSRYKTFCEQPRAGGDVGGNLEMEMDCLQNQLTAVQMLKEALNTENVELQRRLDSALESLRADQREQKHTQCVVCMDNLANVVCLPCKHLALCGDCGAQDKSLASCPICRTSITDRLQVFMP